MIILKNKDTLKNEFISASRKHFCGSTKTHFHEFFEIEFIISGSGICEIDGKEYSVSKNQLFLLTPINTHALRNADTELINVMFRCENRDGLLAFPVLHPFHPTVVQLSDEDGEIIRILLSELVDVHTTDLPYATLLLHCILRKLSRYSQESAHTSLSYLQHAFLYITQNFRDGITLGDTASALNLSPSYFSDLFAKQTGMTFKAYLNNLRFSYVKNLLEFTDMPIAELHLQAGFHDYANFARHFKKRYGLTPTGYRKSKRNASVR